MEHLNTYVGKTKKAIKGHLEKNPNDLVFFSFMVLILLFISVVTPLSPIDNTSKTTEIAIEQPKQERMLKASDLEAEKKNIADSEAKIVKAGAGN